MFYDKYSGQYLEEGCNAEKHKSNFCLNFRYKSHYLFQHLLFFKRMILTFDIIQIHGYTLVISFQLREKLSTVMEHKKSSLIF